MKQPNQRGEKTSYVESVLQYGKIVVDKLSKVCYYRYIRCAVGNTLFNNQHEMGGSELEAYP